MGKGNSIILCSFVLGTHCHTKLRMPIAIHFLRCTPGTGTASAFAELHPGPRFCHFRSCTAPTSSKIDRQVSADKKSFSSFASKLATREVIFLEIAFLVKLTSDRCHNWVTARTPCVFYRYLKNFILYRCLKVQSLSLLCTVWGCSLLVSSESEHKT